MISILRVSALFLVAPALQAEGAGQLAVKLQPAVDNHSLSGAVVLIASKTTVLDLEAVGYADLEAKKPMLTDDEFWIASMSKPMTAAACLMLVDESKISLSDPVEKYLPEFKGMMVKGKNGGPPVPANHPILIREILSHTSGLPFASPMEVPTFDLAPLETRVKSYAKVILNNQPGAQYDYSNAGMNTVGRIIEVVSKEPYEKFLSERVLRPLGMTDTTFVPNSEQLARLAVSYQTTPDKTNFVRINIGQLKYPLNGAGRFPIPAGGLFSTAKDVGKFCQMILNDGTYNGVKLLSVNSVREMTKRQTAPTTGGAYGFGWMMDGNIPFHSGAYATEMKVDPVLGVATVIMVQQAGPWPNGFDLKPIVYAEAQRLAKLPH